MAEHVEEDDAWSVTSTRMLIEFYKKNWQLWDKNYKDNNNKVLTPLVAKFEKSSPPRSLSDIKKRWHGIKSCFQRYMKKSPAKQKNIKWTYWSDFSFLRESENADETGSEMQWNNHDIGKRINLIILTELTRDFPFSIFQFLIMHSVCPPSFA